jgi:signal peptidase I
VCITGSESPVVVVLSESMEPGFRRVSPLVEHNTFFFVSVLFDCSKVLFYIFFSK